MAVYDLAKAMEEAEEVIVFAKANKAAMAYLGAVQHRAKLSGLLVDRIQVETVDIKGALIEARTRVFIFGTIPPKPLTGLTDARGAGHWARHGQQWTRREGESVRRLTEHNDAQSATRGHWRNQDGHGGESNRRRGGTGTRTIGVLPDTFQMQGPLSCLALNFCGADVWKIF